MANLKPGDILVKIGNTNVLGYKLRELRRLVGKIPTGSQLQVIVYRNYKELPEHWKSTAGKLSTRSSEEGESDMSSSSDLDEDGGDDDDETSRVRFKNFRPLSIFWHDLSISIPPVSRTWHTPKKNSNVLIVGFHAGCDIVLHHMHEDDHMAAEREGEEHVAPLYAICSAQSDSVRSTSSSSSSTDSQWIRQLQAPDLDLERGTSLHEGTAGESAHAVPVPNQLPPPAAESSTDQSSSSTNYASTSSLENSASASIESLPQHPQGISSNASIQSLTTIEDFMVDFSSVDTTREDITHEGDLQAAHLQHWTKSTEILQPPPNPPTDIVQH
ncbi:PDZ domain-containing protein 9-like isoform X1 [Leucoraja erinacea]|uniref:PDZ domain-containing protein 9-like isoform X1 n=1 Tax=Leucoraja erinaceus TaxID=7782 RepID=UPI002453DC48|nr:PDZ domain-containing protein 9-like isoform X1 [Leucoraja erinacea]